MKNDVPFVATAQVDAALGTGELQNEQLRRHGSKGEWFLTQTLGP